MDTNNGDEEVNWINQECIMGSRFVLCGAQGTGKSAQAVKIADLLNCSNVIEEWNGRDVIPESTLAVTNSDYSLPAGAVAFTTADHAGIEALINLLQRQAA
jgi:hypothetical protein